MRNVELFVIEVVFLLKKSNNSSFLIPNSSFFCIFAKKIEDYANLLRSGDEGRSTAFH